MPWQAAAPELAVASLLMRRVLIGHTRVALAGLRRWIVHGRA